MDKDDGGPAFPTPFMADPHLPNATYVRADDGMSLRDYFAAKAIGTMDSCDYEKFEHMANDAYRIADAMLSAREAKP